MDEIKNLHEKVNKLLTLEYLDSVSNIINSNCLDSFDYIKENKKSKKDLQNIFIKFLNKVKETFKNEIK